MAEMDLIHSYKSLFTVTKAVLKVLCMVGLLCIASAATYYFACFFSGEDGEISEATHVDTVRELPIIVIDAGHGGIDGGAISPDGGTEKELNLEVAKRLCGIFEFSGFDCIMTRIDDKMLADESMKHHRKMTDLKNRLAVVNKAAESGREVLLVSIHMNNFSIPKYSGLQVWYSAYDERSRVIAEKVQSYSKKWLDEGNNREIKKADSSIYLLDRATFPAVLVECGFLSNPNEYSRLSTPEYQNKLAAVIFAAICEGFYA